MNDKKPSPLLDLGAELMKVPPGKKRAKRKSRREPVKT